VGALISFLGEQTEEDRAAVDRLKSARREEMLQAAQPVGVALHLNNQRALVDAARTLGYEPVVPRRSVSRAIEGPILLRNRAGEYLALANEGGCVVAAASQGQGALDGLMQRYALETVRQHMPQHYQDVSTRTLSDGRTEFIARERAGISTKPAKLKAIVKRDGRIDVDVSCTAGSRCEKLVGAIAKDLGGKVTEINKKPEYWQLPGEPVKKLVKV